MHRDTTVHFYGDIINTLLHNGLYVCPHLAPVRDDVYVSVNNTWGLSLLLRFVLLSKRTFMFSKNRTKHKHVTQ